MRTPSPLLAFSIPHYALGLEEAGSTNNLREWLALAANYFASFCCKK